MAWSGTCWSAPLPLLYGRAALRPAMVMAVTGIVGLLIYKWLKQHAGARAALHPPPRHHAGHAAAGSLQLSVRPHAACRGVHLAGGGSTFPSSAWMLIPLASLIAASRVVLGLHYPSDVLAGGAIGAALALLAQNFL